MSSKLVQALCALVIGSVIPGSLSAQTFESGTARDAYGTPYECLHVALLDSSGKAIDHTVTDSAGQFVFQVPRPAVYRVKFVVEHWMPLVGPLDTLKQADFRERGYALDFKTAIERDSDAGPEVRGDRRRYKLPDGYRLRWAGDSGWTRRDALPPFTTVHYPDAFAYIDTEGSIVGKFIIDTSGKVRRESWRTMASTHREFESIVMKAIPKWRWKPAQNHGQPVCELTLDLIRFGRDSRGGRAVWYGNR
jgi:hypothetical protein